jgi:phage terminase large subunit-like protein
MMALDPFDNLHKRNLDGFDEFVEKCLEHNVKEINFTGSNTDPLLHEFQKEIIANLQNSNDNLFIVAFRGSGKSTIVTTAFPLWSILGTSQKKFCLIFSQTKHQAKQIMQNIRQELEGNEVLKKDLGPFKEVSDEWGIRPDKHHALPHSRATRYRPGLCRRRQQGDFER